MPFFCMQKGIRMREPIVEPVKNPEPESSTTTVENKGRRDFLRHSAAGVSIFVASSPLARAMSFDDEFEVEHKTVRLRRLPEKLKGTKIAMISDIHSGPYMSHQEMLPFMKRIRELKPDVVLIPGDFVDRDIAQADPVCEALRTIEAPYGVYGCTGNHDYYADADYVSNELQNAGVRMLRNEHAVLDIKGEQLALIGVDDIGSEQPFDPAFRQAVQGLKRSIPNILLCHKPYYLDDASEWGVDFMVSGHTHGGQFVLARVLGTVITPAALFSGYIEGLYRRDRSQLYVTRGIGTVGIPVRLNCPPEITLITLV